MAPKDIGRTPCLVDSPPTARCTPPGVLTLALTASMAEGLEARAGGRTTTRSIRFERLRPGDDWRSIPESPAGYKSGCPLRRPLFAVLRICYRASLRHEWIGGRILKAPARQEINLRSALASGIPEFTSPSAFSPAVASKFSTLPAKPHCRRPDYPCARHAGPSRSHLLLSVSPSHAGEALLRPRPPGRPRRHGQALRVLRVLAWRSVGDRALIGCSGRRGPRSVIRV